MRGQVLSRRSDQFVVRMPDGMRDRLKRRAEENRRSLNSEIVKLLELAEAAIPADRTAEPPAAGEASRA